jgi:hypothetical protein
MYFYVFKGILQAKGKAFVRPLFVPVPSMMEENEREPLLLFTTLA